MSQHSGFFDALYTGGVYDRIYSAADYCDNLATIIKNGVRYSAEDDLKVSAGGGMFLNVARGRAWINGHYFYNDTVDTSLSIATAPTGNNARIDRVVVRLDTSVEKRNVELAIVTGRAAANPTAPALTRSGDIFELCLADVYVGSGVTSITEANITDQRENGTVCGWAASVTPAIMSMLRKYEWSEVLTAATSTVAFDIAQYNADDVHIIDVFTNGQLETDGVDYTINGNAINFTSQKQAGNTIKVVLYKSIDGTGIENIVQIVEALQTDIAKLGAVNDFTYVCNGVNDNVLLSERVQAFLNGGTDYATMRIAVVGKVGVTAAAGGTGVSATHYKWFEFGQAASTNRKVIIDFSNASSITIPIAAGTYNDVFYGEDVHVIGANVIANNNAAGTYIRMFSSAAGVVVAEDCRFWITANITSYISQTGTFIRCRGSVTCNGANAYCFYPTAAALLRVYGGEYYAYSATGFVSAVVYVTAATAVAILYALNCPANTRSGFVQSYAVYASGGKVSITDTITTLELSAAVANIRGTLAVSKPGAM